MVGLSRWAGDGGSYRTIQRFYQTAIPWTQLFWQFFSQSLWRKENVYILAGDECVVSKPRKKTYGLDYFFSGLQQKVIPSLSFFILSLVSVQQHQSYPLSMVIDMDGQRIGFGKSAVGNLTKYLSALILCIGFLMAWFDEKHQALPDKLTSTLVIE